jgi:uncharacterized protein (TIGR02598 family)
MSLLQRKKYLRRSERAFSLVEVAIAFGILAFAMVALIGLLPLTLTTFRETKRDTVHANILQYIAAAANLTPFTNLPTASFATNTTPWTFDDQGEVISQAATTNTADTSPAIYSAYITVSYTNSSINPALLPGASTYSTNTYLLTVEIIDADQPTRPTTNTIVVANMGK